MAMVTLYMVIFDNWGYNNGHRVQRRDCPVLEEQRHRITGLGAVAGDRADGLSATSIDNEFANLAYPVLLPRDHINPGSLPSDRGVAE